MGNIVTHSDTRQGKKWKKEKGKGENWEKGKKIKKKKMGKKIKKEKKIFFLLGTFN